MSIMGVFKLGIVKIEVKLVINVDFMQKNVKNIEITFEVNENVLEY